MSGLDTYPHRKSWKCKDLRCKKPVNTTNTTNNNNNNNNNRPLFNVSTRQYCSRNKLIFIK